MGMGMNFMGMGGDWVAASGDGDGVKADGDGVGTGKYLWRCGWCPLPCHSLFSTSFWLQLAGYSTVTLLTF